MNEHLEKARENGFNESKAGKFFTERLSKQIAGEKEDEFYLKVKKIQKACRAFLKERTNMAS